MARLFALNQSLSQGIPVVAGPPFTFGAWVNTSVLTSGNLVIMTLRSSASQNTRFCIDLFNGVPRIITLLNSAGSVVNSSAGSLALNTWVYISGVWTSSTSRALYVNGVLVGSDTTTSVVPGTMALTQISGLNTLGGGGSNGFVGAIALPGIWSIAQTQAQIQSIITSFYPSTVATGLVAAPPLSSGFSPEPDPVFSAPWTVMGTPALAVDPNAVVVPGTSFSDTNQANMPVGSANEYSYYLQPWKSYLDTWPGSRFTDAIGVNFRPGAGNETGTAAVLAAAGVTHARVEVAWNVFTYANESVMDSGHLNQYTTTFTAFANNGIRPLVLLMAERGGPCPATNLTLNVTVAAGIGATSITVASTTGIVVGKTGLNGQVSGVQANPLITTVNGLVCTLSQPLAVAIPIGSITATTLLYHPLTTDSANGNTFSAATITGWSRYVTNICTFLHGILGNNNFDLECWNELSSDSVFITSSNYYSPAEPNTGALNYSSTTYPGYTQTGREVLASVTVDAAAAFPGVRVINGFANQRPQDCAFNTPPGMFMSRHYYSKLNTSSPIDQGNSGISSPSNPIAGFATFPPVNAIFGYDGVPAQTNVLPSGYNSVVNTGSFFIPSFTLSAPESLVGFATYYLYMCIDLQPFPSLRIDGPGATIYRGPHWRGGVNPTSGLTVPMWETETNSDRSAWTNFISTTTGVAQTDQRIIDLNNYAAAKCLLRLYTFHCSKGVQTVCVFADRNIGQPLSLSIIPEAFYTALAANGGVLTPAIQALAGAQISALTNMMNFIKNNSSGSFTITPIQMGSVAENSPGREWAGDGTPAHPDQLNVNNFGIFPFQVAANLYAIAYYVVTHNVVNNYGVNTNLLDPLNYQMPDKGFLLTLNGVNGQAATVSCYDPLSNTSPAVSNVSTGTSSLQMGVLATDTPRFLLVSTSAGTISASVRIL